MKYEEESSTSSPDNLQPRLEETDKNRSSSGRRHGEVLNQRERDFF
jgi:hypothetical protein